MTRLEKALNRFVLGDRGHWYYQFNIGDHELGGGMFFRKEDARNHMAVKLCRYIHDESILLEYLTLREQHDSQ